MANTVSYPTLVPTPPAGGGVGLPQAKNVVPWSQQFSDQSIRGAAKVNPAFAPYMVAGRFTPEFPVPGNNEPGEVKSKPVAQNLATQGAPNAWKKRTLAAMSNAVMFGGGKPQKPFKVPWNKAFIPPLALFNDASQWVNRLMFNRPMDAHDNGSSDPPLRSVLYSLPMALYGKPLNTNNLAGGTLNAQLQLGQIAIQAQQLTISASNYFGGS